MKIIILISIVFISIISNSFADDFVWDKKKPIIFYLKEVSSDPEYGKTEEKPINVGGYKETGGHGGQRWFLKQLREISDKPFLSKRTGHCCWHKSPNGYKGMGALDKYEINIIGEEKSIYLYLNSYKYEQPKIPQGFTTEDEYNKPFKSPVKSSGRVRLSAAN